MAAMRKFPLAILAKAPLPGQVKTRLIPRLGAEGAARLHRHLVWRTLETAVAATAAESITLWTSLAFPGEPEHAFFDICSAHFGIQLQPQPESDLGLRMYAALAAMPGPGLVIGCDCPMLDAALLRQCQTALASSECVLLPAEDGGYALVGARLIDPRLFQDIDWGTERVFTQTLERLDALGWRHACPATVWDIDRPADLERLLGLPNDDHRHNVIVGRIDTQ